jgi:tetratricopeptide (TPR) repeat protein
VDDNETARRGVAASLDDLGLDDADRRWVEPALLTLLGLAPPPPGGRDVLFAGWRIYLERLAAAPGLVALAFDDLHEAAPDLLDFLDHVVRWAKGTPILVLGLARPELLERRPAWGEERAPTAPLRLAPLGPDAVGRLLAGVVPELPVALAQLVVERADGIPLYAVETLRMLAGEGLLVPDRGGWRPSPRLTGIAVPATLRELIAARLDAAGPTDRALLEDAAVLGVRFDPAALAAVSTLELEIVEGRLAGLVEREFLVRIGASGVAAVLSHAFVHPLVREVAYATLSRADRRERHLRAARHFASLDDADAAGTIASHYLAAHRASRPGPEANELAARTRDALRAAAERALALGAPDEAVGLAEAALTLPMTPAQEADLLEIAGWATNATGRNVAAEQYGRRVLAFREAEGDPNAVARAVGWVALVLQDAGRVAAGVPMLEEALGRLQPGQAPEGEAAILAYLSRLYYLTGRFEECIGLAERALALARPRGLDDLVTEALVNKAGALDNLGRRDEAIAMHEDVIRVAHLGGGFHAGLRARTNLGVSLSDDDLPRAVAVWREALEGTQKLGWPVSVHVSNITGGLLDMATDWDGAVRSLEELLATDLEPADRQRLERNVVLILAARGELEDARLAAWEEHVGELEDPQIVAVTELARSNVAWCRGDFDAAARTALAGAGSPFAYPALEGLRLALRGATWLRDVRTVRSLATRLEAVAEHTMVRQAAQSDAHGLLAALEGRVAQAVPEIDGAIRTWRAAGYDLAAAQAALDLAFIVGPGVPEARAAAEEARAVFERVRAKVYLDRLDAVLAGGAGAPTGRVASVAAADAANP